MLFLVSTGFFILLVIFNNSATSYFVQEVNFQTNLEKTGKIGRLEEVNNENIMLMHWEKTEDLPIEMQIKIGEVVKKIQKILKYRKPRTDISISLGPEPDETEVILKELEFQEKVLKINKLDRSTNFADISIYQKKFDKLYKKLEDSGILSEDSSVKTEIIFDSLNGTLYKGSEVYKPSSKRRRKLLQKLWEERKETKAGQTIKEGKPFPKEALAVQSELVDSTSDFKKNSAIKNQFKGEIKELNRIFANKNWPLKISTKKGVQLTYNHPEV